MYHCELSEVKEASHKTIVANVRSTLLEIYDNRNDRIRYGHGYSIGSITLFHRTNRILLKPEKLAWVASSHSRLLYSRSNGLTIF
jgi:hypothetical protein